MIFIKALLFDFIKKTTLKKRIFESLHLLSSIFRDLLLPTIKIILKI